MKKKVLIVLAGIFGFLLVMFTVITLNAKMTCKRMFGIDESKYEVVKKDCTMSRIKQGGEMDIYLKVREDQIDRFIQDIESYGAEFVDRTLVQPSDWDKFIEWNMLMDPAEVERFYHGGRFERRTFISYFFSPASEVSTYITISACKEGYYDVRLWGRETEYDILNWRAWRLS